MRDGRQVFVSNESRRPGELSRKAIWPPPSSLWGSEDLIDPRVRSAHSVADTRANHGGDDEKEDDDNNGNHGAPPRTRPWGDKVKTVGRGR